MTDKHTITFDYRLNAFSRVICRATRKADLNDLWVRVNNYWFKIELQHVALIDGKPNPAYKPNSTSVSC